jgi:hypothetical protein
MPKQKQQLLQQALLVLLLLPHFQLKQQLQTIMQH